MERTSLVLHGRIISLRGQVWVHKTSLTQSLFIEVYVPREESERTCICVLGYRFGLFLCFFLLNFGTVPIV